jgi:hypothetical protein
VLQGGCQRRGDQEPYAPLLEALERHLQHQLPTDRGVPFLLVSCARGLRTSAVVGGTADAVPWDLMQAIRQRVAALSESARQALDAAAVVRRRVSLSVLSAVLAQPEEAVLAALEAACQARLLEEQGKVLSSLG